MSSFSFFFLSVLSSCLIKHANLNKTTVVHTAGSANSQLNNNEFESKNTSDNKLYLQDGRQLRAAKDQKQILDRKNSAKPRKSK
jgi:hypothetical protein